MANSYLRGSTFLKYLNVLRVTGSVPTFPADYSAPTFSVYYKNGIFTAVALDVPMTQGLDNIWYLIYSIPVNAGIGTYFIKYKTTIDGVPTETTEDFNVALEHNPLLDGGNGSCTITDLITDGTNPVPSADVYVFSSVTSSVVLAHVLTDASGNFTVYLNAGTYYLFANKPGVLNTENLLEVHSDCTHTLTSVVPPLPPAGTFEITDNVESDALANLQGVDVTVFLASDTVNAIAHANTDSNGNFTVYLDAGTYLVLFNKAGYISETHQMTVLSDGSHSFIGN